MNETTTLRVGVEEVEESVRSAYRLVRAAVADPSARSLLRTLERAHVAAVRDLDQALAAMEKHSDTISEALGKLNV